MLACKAGLTLVAVGLLLMMYPILCKVQYETLHQVFAHRQIWVQLGFSIVVNWIIAPLLMVSTLGDTRSIYANGRISLLLPGRFYLTNPVSGMDLYSSV
jgi:ACR3 family arsenite efflux pump ArsB